MAWFRTRPTEGLDMRIPATLLVALLTTLCGCGLLHVPYAVTLPSKSLRCVHVLDHKTREPVADAYVSFHVTKWHNWMKQPLPSWIACEDPLQEGSGAPCDQESDRVASWEAVRDKDGSFSVRPRTFCAWVSVWFPLPCPLGWFLYYTYDGVLEVSAPGYRTLWISDSGVGHAIKWGKAVNEGARRPTKGTIALRDSAVVVYLARRPPPVPDSKTTSK